jgi:hypothetical protein
VPIILKSVSIQPPGTLRACQGLLMGLLYIYLLRDTVRLILAPCFLLNKPMPVKQNSINVAVTTLTISTTIYPLPHFHKRNEEIKLYS